MTRRRHVPVLAACALLLVALAGCAPDPDEVTDSTEAVFADLVDAVGAIDTTVLRTLEVAPVAEVACADDDSAQQAYTATGTLAVEATDADAQQVFDVVGEEVDGVRWDRIRVDRDLVQRAWADDDGIVVSLTASGSVLTLAVFTPCLS